MEKSTFQKYMDGEIGNFGSFHTALLELYKLADGGNRKKLETAFPEWFLTGEERQNKSRTYTQEELDERLDAQVCRTTAQVLENNNVVKMKTVLEDLVDTFPEFDTDEEMSGADTIEALAHIYQNAKEALGYPETNEEDEENIN